MLEGILTCLFVLSGVLFLLSIKRLKSIFRLSWLLPLKFIQLLTYISLSVFFFISAQQLNSYFLFTKQAPLVEVAIHSIHPSKYRISLKPYGQPSEARLYEIYGDLWQIDLRILAWHPIIAGFGLDTLSRIERISGRYHSAGEEFTQPKSIYELYEKNNTDIFWRELMSLGDGVLVRSYYGSALYAPMADKAVFGVFLTDSGTELRPLNESAKEALIAW